MKNFLKQFLKLGSLVLVVVLIMVGAVSYNFKNKKADILISVTGSEGLIGKDHIKDGAVVIDVGSPRGDVRTEEIMEKALFISPVPGGVGPVTIYSLLENLVDATSSIAK